MTTMTAKVSTNYTQEMIDNIVSTYEANPVRATVDALAAEFDKTPRSVIAKLSALGVYVKPTPVTKTGAPVVRKSEIIAQIQDALGGEFPSLEKASKADLEALLAVVVSR